MKPNAAGGAPELKKGEGDRPVNVGVLVRMFDPVPLDETDLRLDSEGAGDDDPAFSSKLPTEDL